MPRRKRAFIAGALKGAGRAAGMAALHRPDPPSTSTPPSTNSVPSLVDPALDSGSMMDIDRLLKYLEERQMRPPFRHY